MIQYNPFLKINKLLIISNEGKIAFEQEFHLGVNIIRGNNSAGKSTISNFIFYVLGGEFTKWTTHALLCREVIAEVEINSAIITLKREISEKRSQPMFVFFGNYEDSKKSGSENWQIFPFSRSANKKSFSNALFLALGFPELKGDFDNNITMHQILRLMYIDQKSLTQDLMMTDSFDSSITRTTLGDLMLGVYDDSLYADKLALREAIKDHELKQKQYDGIRRIFSSSGAETNIEIINALIKENIDQLKNIEEALQNDDFRNVTVEEPELNIRIESLKTGLLDSKRTYTKKLEEIQEYEYEIYDSDEFISSLEKRSKAVDESLITRELLGEVDLSHCPHCLNVLDDPISEMHCKLCKQGFSEDKIKSHHKKMQQELDNQIRESRFLQKERRHILEELKSSLPAIMNEIRTIQLELDTIVNNYQNTRSTEYDYLLEKKGELRSKNKYLIEQQNAIKEVDALKNELVKLSGSIASLNKSITFKERERDSKLARALNDIKQITLGLLEKDGDRQKEFSTAKSVQLDFARNTFALDGKNNFSESSNVYLKNSIRFAVFFASLMHEFFRYPRFILCDNIEDKGMQPERSKSFQRAIVELSKKFNVKHQIIFTTSMIDEELNNTNLCIGEFYTKENKTLKNIET